MTSRRPRTTMSPFTTRRSRPPLRRHAAAVALLAAVSVTACGGADEDTEQAASSSDARTSAPSSSPTSREQDAGASHGTPIRITFGDTELTGRLLDNATARDLGAQLPLTLTFPGPQQRGEDRVTAPRTAARRGAHRPRPRRRRHRLLGARRRLRPLLRRSGSVLERHRAHRRARRRQGCGQATSRWCSRVDRACRLSGGEKMARVLITGSADGLGRAAAETLLGDGHEVLIHSRTAERLAAFETLLGR